MAAGLGCCVLDSIFADMYTTRGRVVSLLDIRDVSLLVSHDWVGRAGPTNRGFRFRKAWLNRCVLTDAPQLRVITI
jgi:hypothetical protein